MSATTTLSQTARILKLLQKRKTGVLNTELNEVCFRYGARIHDLRSEGWVIVSQPESRSLWRFTLTGHKEEL